MTLQQFSEIFALLAVQLRFMDADEATIRGYYKALSDVDAELVAMAAHRFALGASLNEQGEAWFPKAPEWRAMAVKVRTERRTELESIIRKRRTVGQMLCLDCEDTGWSEQRGRYGVCSCREARRLEIIGRRPMPALPSSDEGDLEQLVKVDAMIAHTVKGMR